MRTFTIIDTLTGREVSAETIEYIAKNTGLKEIDIDQFFIGEDGQLALADECGNIAYCDMNNLKFMVVFNGKYPDLEYFESLFLGNIRHLNPDAFADSFFHPIVELVAMFPQTWPNTAGGFAEPGMVAGQAFITEITTVLKAYVHDTKEVYYSVSFGNKPAYIVSDANETFFEDLKNMQMKSIYDAAEAYCSKAVEK